MGRGGDEASAGVGAASAAGAGGACASAGVGRSAKLPRPACRRDEGPAEPLGKSELLERAGMFPKMLRQCLGEMDEHQRSAYEANRKRCATKLRRAGVAAPMCDMVRAMAAMAEWGGEGRYMRALERCGISQADMLHARYMDADMAAVYMWCRDKREAMRRERLEDEVDELHDTAMDLARDVDGENKVNPRLVTDMLERLDRANMGTERERGDGGRGKVSVTYNVPGLTVNMITAPGMLGAAGEKVAEVVDMVSEDALPAPSGEASGEVVDMDGAGKGREAAPDDTGRGCWKAMAVDAEDRA